MTEEPGKGVIYERSKFAVDSNKAVQGNACLLNLNRDNRRLGGFMSKAFKITQKIQWKWLGRNIQGEILEVFHESITKTIKGKKIKRNGTLENPAYLVRSDAGNIALKLASELAPLTRAKANKGAKGPKLFS